MATRAATLTSPIAAAGLRPSYRSATLSSSSFSQPKANLFNSRPQLFTISKDCTNESTSYFLRSSSRTRPFSLRVNAGAPDVQTEVANSGAVGANDLLIVGPGVLGRLVAQQWQNDFSECQVYGQTATTGHHDELAQMGIKPCLKETKPAHQFPYVIFCAPPSRNLNYVGDIREAMSNWNGEGTFLFTSSSATYDCNDNGYCDESTPSVPLGRNPRADVLLEAEEMVLRGNGCVLRLAGLYKAQRGPHKFWLEKGTVDSRPDHLVNLIHYEDAASLTVTILRKNIRGQIFLGCDNHPLSRKEIMDLVNKSGKFNKKFDGFTGTDGPLGKRLDNSKTRAALEWEPKYCSYGHFLETM